MMRGDALIVEEDGMFKVQAGLFRVKANADAQLMRVQAAGFEAFIKEIGKAQQEKKLEVGATVTVLKNITYTGQQFRVYYDKYDVLQIEGDRVVIGIGKTVTCAIDKKNISVV